MPKGGKETNLTLQIHAGKKKKKKKNLKKSWIGDLPATLQAVCFFISQILV